MLSIERSGAGLYWHVMYNSIMLNCCATKREAIAAMEVYKTYEGML
jgi:hypothetical protein